jgi:hypothetical protein
MILPVVFRGKCWIAIIVRRTNRTPTSALSRKFGHRFWQYVLFTKGVNSDPNPNTPTLSGNNIKIRMFKIQNKAGPAQWVFRFGNSYFVYLNLFRVSIFGFRILRFPETPNINNLAVILTFPCEMGGSGCNQRVAVVISGIVEYHLFPNF